ncbi:radical SAM protein [Streptomyces sp. DSM 44915]|uniref:Radical SAM protein n=1 Tax=Streptomyces chisholmiae TaxID=3075540 RepID=A0ABU2JRV7_9ACTN|nr:radical SAM protein [Streptomyces sp. DSM 44915]MDT0267448.1 radical SAM protein [Streptomyces sp. DSM 44915]
MLDEQDVMELLLLRGAEQERLFERARAVRQEVFGSEVVVRGVSEITNQCRVNCVFCPMRRDNTRHNSDFRMDTERLVDIAASVRANDIDVVFFQGGEIPQTTRVVGEAIPAVRELYDGDVEILLNLGNKRRGEYEYLREQGATSYILKFETSDPTLNERMRRETLESRLTCLRDLLDLGYRVGTGSIIGLPDQDVASVARDLVFARDLGVHMCSVAPFVPAPDTPLAGHQGGDVELTLNAIAVSRLLGPSWLIPSVSALSKRAGEGQYRGLMAGANVITVNFTPDEQRDRYLIYGRDRFVVKRDYARDVIARAGLTPRGSVFLDATAGPAAPCLPQHTSGAA